MDIGTTLIGGASALMAIGLTVLMARVVIGVSAYFRLEARIDAEATRAQDDFGDDGEYIEVIHDTGMSLDDLIRQYDREQDE